MKRETKYTEAKRNQTKRNSPKRNELYRDETKSIRNEINRNEIHRNETKRIIQNEIKPPNYPDSKPTNIDSYSLLLHSIIYIFLIFKSFLRVIDTVEWYWYWHLLVIHALIILSYKSVFIPFLKGRRACVTYGLVADQRPNTTDVHASPIIHPKS